MAEPKTRLDERPHDVLAAEAFAMPAPDPELHHHGPIALPEDPTGIEEPHDVLAAEEFPMPAPRPSGSSAVAGVGNALARHAGGLGTRGIAVVAGLAGALLIVLRRSARGRPAGEHKDS
jgi:hypothetical protein